MDFCQPDIAKRLVLEITDILVMHGELAEDAFNTQCNASQATEFYHDYGSRNTTIPGACSRTVGAIQCQGINFHLAKDRKDFVDQVKLDFVNQDWVDSLG